MTPLTRKENYLNEIVGWGETAPEKPLTPEEFFFAAILGEAVQTPEPLSRYQIYLAKIAGRNISVPKPLTRLEIFLAKACGMDIETPTPITREEIFWSNYSAIVNFEVEGVPPLTYKAIEGTLENYRIYGNTVDGESVGDRTGNLFDYVTMSEGVTSTYINADGDELANGGWNVTDYIPCDGTVFTLNVNPYTGNLPAICLYDDNKHYITGAAYSNRSTITVSANQNAKYIRFSYSNSFDLSTVMLNSGSTPLPYEPYGYKVPVTISNGTDTLTTPIYLSEQIKMVGDEAEYVDYGEQKMHRVRKNLLPNTATSETIDGVTVTVNEDGSITCDGTARKTIDLRLATNFSLPAGKYCLTGTPSGGGTSSYYLRAWYSSKSVVWLDDSGNGIDFTLTNTTSMRSSIVIWPNQVVDNITFYPMIRKADIEDDTYEPYIEDTDLDVTLPALPTIKGTNVLSVGTAVQPSKVYVKYKGERQ